MTQLLPSQSPEYIQALETENAALREGTQALINSGNHVSIESLRSPQTGQEVANQINMWIGQIKAFFSYGTLIAIKDYDQKSTQLTSSWDFSRTTVKYLKQFLGDESLSMNDIRARIKNGSYVLDPELTIHKALEANKRATFLNAVAQLSNPEPEPAKRKAPAP